MIDFFEKTKIELSDFQRSYAWDKKNASKFIESLLVRIPIPQIFLHQIPNNRFSILDGQQRLLSIYFFYKGVFPRTEKVAEIRKLLIENKKFTDDFLHDKNYFEDFKLTLSNNSDDKKNPFDGLDFQHPPP